MELCLREMGVAKVMLAQTTWRASVASTLAHVQRPEYVQPQEENNPFTADDLTALCHRMFGGLRHMQNLLND